MIALLGGATEGGGGDLKSWDFSEFLTSLRGALSKRGGASPVSPIDWRKDTKNVDTDNKFIIIIYLAFGSETIN